MIDIHAHILPAMDDGAADLEESLAMCQVAVEDGIEVIAATPHSWNGQFTNHPAQILEKVLELNAELKAKGFNLEVLPGMEVRVVPHFGDLYSQGEILALNQGKYFLVEFHPFSAPPAFHALVGHLWSLGYGVILGHPEKNLAIQQNPGYLATLLAHFRSWEMLVQVSADSLAGEAGPHAARAARTLLKQGLVHVIASDAHGSHSRSPRLSRAVRAAEEIVEPEWVRKMVYDIPLAVLRGSPFPEAWQPQVRSGWQQFKRKWF